MKKLSIVVPIYGDWPSLKENIIALKKYTPGGVKVYYVNDCGPEVESIEQNVQKLIRKNKNFFYSRNPENLGFVKTCNRAFNEVIAQDSDAVLLLNSDAVVTKDAIKEQLSVLFADESIAAVCPRSNNATIFSYPLHSEDLTMEESHRLYKKNKKNLPRMYYSPLAHGFCLMIKVSVVRQIGLFDLVYGQGYGEENDFCMRALKAGYKCAVANHAYVFHYGAKSFTSQERAKRVQANEKILFSRYPEFTGHIYAYIQTISQFEDV